jgi:hypothetical protein
MRDHEFAEPGVAFVHRTDRPFRLRVPAARLGFDLLTPRARRKQHTRGDATGPQEGWGRKLLQFAASPSGAWAAAAPTILGVRGRRLLVGAVLAGTLVVAGCGGATSYDAEKTRSCLADQPGVKLSNKVDFVASTALGGAFNAKLLGNQVTLAFAQDRKEAGRIVRAYQRFRGKNIGLTDVLRPSHNVVALWEAHPSDTALQTIEDCLK